MEREENFVKDQGIHVVKQEVEKLEDGKSLFKHWWVNILEYLPAEEWIGYTEQDKSGRGCSLRNHKHLNEVTKERKKLKPYYSCYLGLGNKDKVTFRKFRQTGKNSLCIN